jgi:hypothetical protein
MTLEYEMKVVQQVIEAKEKQGKDTTFERELIKEWRRYLPGGDKNSLWLTHTEAGPGTESQNKAG